MILNNYIRRCKDCWAPSEKQLRSATGDREKRERGSLTKCLSFISICNYSQWLLNKLFKICFILLPGEWSNGHLEGKGRLVTKNTTVWECWFHLSCLHGPVRKIEMKKFRMFKQQGIIMLFIFIFFGQNEISKHEKE